MHIKAAKQSPIQICKVEARRFLLTHQFLLPPRNLAGKNDILKFVGHVGCIQFDPIDIVGRNPDLVLQSRIKDYRRTMLEELLYQDKLLMDGWDKVSSIFLTLDWPHFSRFRQRMTDHYFQPDHPLLKTGLAILEEIRSDGSFGASQSKNHETINWSWGRPVRVERAALEILFAVNKIQICGRYGSRKVYDLLERMIPPDVLATPDPHPTDEDYHEWHLLRRMGGLGLVQMGASEFWLGIQKMKTPQRLAALERLKQKAEVIEVTIRELPGKSFFIRSKDLPALESACSMDMPDPQVSFLPPLDNLLWDRKLLKYIFDFDYIWEIYKPAKLRQYGHYILPVLYGDRFIARTEIIHNRKTASISMRNWWWEQDVKPNRAMNAAIQSCLDDFSAYLGVEEFIRWKNQSEL